MKVLPFPFQYLKHKKLNPLIMKNEEVEILLVEDNKQDAEMAIRALKKSNLVNNLIHLKDGAQAIDFLFGNGEFAGRNIDNKPNLILLDLKMPRDRKSTRLNSSHSQISYAVFCLKKKTKIKKNE